MARAARGVLPSESVVLISISSGKMSRASRRSASDRPDWVAPTRGSRASVSAAHATRATKRITRRMASIYRIGPEAERAQDGADAGPLIDRTDVVVGVERQADVVRAGGRREPLLLGAPLEAPPRGPVQDPDGARAGRGSPRPPRCEERDPERAAWLPQQRRVHADGGGVGERRDGLVAEQPQEQAAEPLVLDGFLHVIEPPRHHTVGLDQVLAQRSEEHTSELQSLAYLVCRLLLEKKKKKS